MTQLFDRLTRQETDATEARNGLRHVLALSFSKVSDGLIDPKLVLSWLLSAIGVPTAFIGMLVPIREAGALLPQVVMAGRLQRMRQRRWVWVTGSAGQGLAALVIALAALTLTGWIAGLAICVALAVLAVSRAACSVSYKDILGKTVGQTRRGTVTGTAGSVASAVVFAFAALLVVGILRSEGAVIGAIAVAGLLWLASSAAGFLSSYVWGWMADRSSRAMLLVAGLLGAAAMGAAMLAHLSGVAGTVWAIPCVLFVLMVAYHGVRQARSTYLVDISPEDRRSVDAAVANTAIGIILLAAGAVGGALTWIGPLGALAGFAAMSLAGGMLALRLVDTGGES